MAAIETLFVTRIYRGELAGAGSRRLVAELERACLSLAADDAAGIAWCAANGYPGYTSYASLDDLPRRFPEFQDLARRLDGHVAEFAATLELELGGRPLVLDSLWVNVLPEGGYHTAHIHPHAAISGTVYVAVPKGAGAIRFEDPRLPMMMSAPPRKARASLASRTFVSLEPRAGAILLWESWLRHEVPRSRASGVRISVSFNYRWGGEAPPDDDLGE